MKTHRYAVRALFFGKKKYGCGSCGASFGDRDELLKHAEKIHNKETTYLCITCDEEFNNESSFRMHMARDHRI
jgi:DNA-directed RNA polymerase subunit RPC12/RpoP